MAVNSKNINEPIPKLKICFFGSRVFSDLEHLIMKFILNNSDD